MEPGLYRFDQFFYERLYGHDGYYRHGNGVTNDYDTFVNISNHLTTRLGKWLNDWWILLGEPSTYNVYEIGAGDGTLCRKLLALDLPFTKYAKYHAVEINENYANSYPDGVLYYKELTINQPKSGVMFGNEVLDVQPIRFVAFREDEWQELYIKVNKTNNATYEWHTLYEPLPLCVSSVEGVSIPWFTHGANFLKSITTGFTGPLLMIDYARPKTRDFKNINWLRCMKDMKIVKCLDVSINYDISSFVPIDQVMEMFYEPKVLEQVDWFGTTEWRNDNYYVMEWLFNKGQFVNEDK